MISVIIPVYNVEPYLRKCLDSVVNQTYRDLEILIIDDGSTDGSGTICDVYKQDDRVKVFHTKNRGLSCARNLGLDEAKGEWIGFVDSDDWVEPDMYEVLLRKAEETGADIVECGVLREYPGRTVEVKKDQIELSGKDAVVALLNNEISTTVWNKLWKSRCFEQNRFLNGRIYEDVTTTYRVFDSVDRVCNVAVCKYHYLLREGSLSRRLNIQNYIDYWLAHKERYDYLDSNSDESLKRVQLRFCAKAVARMWAHYCDFPSSETSHYADCYQEMNRFTKEHIPLFGDNGWSLRQRVGVFFPHFLNTFSFRTAWLMNQVATILFRKIEVN